MDLEEEEAISHLKNFFVCKKLPITVQGGVFLDKKRVSSTNIRSLIKEGSLSRVTGNLGRYFFIIGKVEEGDKRGRKLNYPTINIKLEKDRVYPKFGVYISRVIFKGLVYHAVTNIGVRPTFNKNKQAILESHIFDFDGQLYGESIEVEFIKRIRGERAFLSADELLVQISSDINYARIFFANSMK